MNKLILVLVLFGLNSNFVIAYDHSNTKNNNHKRNIDTNSNRRPSETRRPIAGPQELKGIIQKTSDNEIVLRNGSRVYFLKLNPSKRELDLFSFMGKETVVQAYLDPDNKTAWVESIRDH